MNTCDTCKWWKSEDSFVQHKCINPSVTGRTSAHDSSENVMMLRSDAKEWEGLYTGPHFGCIHWEQK